MFIARQHLRDQSSIDPKRKGGFHSDITYLDNMARGWEHLQFHGPETLHDYLSGVIEEVEETGMCCE